MNRAKMVVDSEGRFCGIRYNCPGCGDRHVLPVHPVPEGMVESPHYASGHHWTWNGSLELPTFSPSVLVRSGHHADGNPECWCNYGDRFPGEVNDPTQCYLCHSFVNEGRAQLLNDCTHAHAGQTLDLPAVDGSEQD